MRQILINCFPGSGATWGSIQILTQATCHLFQGTLQAQALRFSEMYLCLPVRDFLYSPKLSDGLWGPLPGGQVRLLLSPGKKRPKRWLLNSVKCQGWEWVELYLHPPIMCLHGMDRNNGTWPILHVSGRKARCFDSSMRIFKNCVSEFIKIWISRFFPRRLK